MRARSLKSIVGAKLGSALPIRIEPGGGQKSSYAGFVNAEVELPPVKNRELSMTAPDRAPST